MKCCVHCGALLPNEETHPNGVCPTKAPEVAVVASQPDELGQAAKEIQTKLNQAFTQFLEGALNIAELTWIVSTATAALADLTIASFNAVAYPESKA